MVSVLASSAADRGFEPRSGQTKDYKIGIICSFSAINIYIQSPVSYKVRIFDKYI